MKQLALCLLLLALPFFAYAQAEALRKKTTGISFDSAARRVLAEKMADYPNDTFEGWKLATYRRWVEFWENRVCNDAPNDSFQLEPANRALYNYMSQAIDYCGSLGQYSGNWHCLGPYTSYYGRGLREYLMLPSSPEGGRHGRDGSCLFAVDGSAPLTMTKGVPE